MDAKKLEGRFDAVVWAKDGTGLAWVVRLLRQKMERSEEIPGLF